MFVGTTDPYSLLQFPSPHYSVQSPGFSYISKEKWRLFLQIKTQDSIREDSCTKESLNDTPLLLCKQVLDSLSMSLTSPKDLFAGSIVRFILLIFLYLLQTGWSHTHDPWPWIELECFLQWGDRCHLGISHPFLWHHPLIPVCGTGWHLHLLQWFSPKVWTHRRRWSQEGTEAPGYSFAI